MSQDTETALGILMQYFSQKFNRFKNALILN